jgi:galactose mutarotase-like enzyme
MVTSLTVGGDQVLYLDRATLDDTTQKVRGGIPILFPVAGRLPDDTYRVGERSFQLPQHGFARELTWNLVNSERRSCELRLAANDWTLERFPFRFDVRMRYRASGNTLTIEQTVANLDTQPMPLHAGFHPYFFLPDGDKAQASITTDATRAFDNRAGAERAVEKLDLTADEVDLALLDHGARETRIERPGRRTLRLTWDAPFSTLVVWTQKGKDFLCVEPWTAAPGALSSGEGLPHVGPRETRKSFFAITAME